MPTSGQSAVGPDDGGVPAAMPLIIDTYNVLHVTGVLPPDLAGLDIAGLARLIGQSRYRHEPTTLVCDGVASDPGSGTGPRISVVYAGSHLSADDLIARLVSRSSSARRLLVVSTDRAVMRDARRAGARVIRSDDFLEQLVDDAGRPTATPKSVAPNPPAPGTNGWLGVFGLTDADLAIPAAGPPVASTEPADPGHQNAAEPDFDQITREAEALARRFGLETGEPDAADAQQDGDDTTSTTPAAEIRPAPDSAIVPPDVIAEAEKMWKRASGKGRAES